jgi:hypothetical protein
MTLLAAALNNAVGCEDGKKYIEDKAKLTSVDAQ